MKKFILFLVITASISSCGPDYKSEVDNLKREQDSLLSLKNSQDSLINIYFADLNEIQTNINNLTSEENILIQKSSGSNEISKKSKEEILYRIEEIRKLISDNKNKLSNLRIKLNKSNSKIVELESLIASLNLQLVEKDSSINKLNESILALNVKVNDLQNEIDSAKIQNNKNQQEIAFKTEKLHTAYYTIGDYQNLKKLQVLSKEGDLFGIGGKMVVKSDFNQASFIKIDYTKTTYIDLMCKKADLVSIHPSNSYKFVNENKKIMGIEITDPEKFWSTSKYLVMVIDQK